MQTNFISCPNAPEMTWRRDFEVFADKCEYKIRRQLFPIRSGVSTFKTGTKCYTILKTIHSTQAYNQIEQKTIANKRLYIGNQRKPPRNSINHLGQPNVLKKRHAQSNYRLSLCKSKLASKRANLKPLAELRNKLVKSDVKISQSTSDSCNYCQIRPTRKVISSWSGCKS